MKHQVYIGLLFGFLLLFMSCASTMSMYIDVEKPAVVTLPVNAQNVIIVNNALSQPMGYGLAAPSGKYPEMDSLYARTLKIASWYVIKEAFNSMDDSKFFQDVSFYKKTLRADNEWLAVVPIDENIKNDFFENENFDLLISIDRVLFNSIPKENKVGLEKMEAMLTFTAYLRDKEADPIVLTIMDSVMAIASETDYYNGIPCASPEEINTALIRQAASNLGKELGMFFTPGWETVDRTYFVRNLSDAAQMDKFINKGKWVEAQNTWIGEFNRTRKVVDQARLATNIALAYEMNSDFNKAEEWAIKSKTFFQNASATKYSKEIQYLEEYIKELQERQKENTELDKQYGIS